EYFPAINVMEFIRAGEQGVPGFEKKYNLLCDVSHPSIMHLNLRRLTEDGSWGNPLYAEEAHRILQELATSAEMAVAGIELQARTIYQECLPKLAAEIEQKSREPAN